MTTRTGTDNLSRVIAAIEERGGTISPIEAAAATGLSVDAATDALERTIELYAPHLRYDSTGTVIFHFVMPLARRSRRTIREFLWPIARTVKKTFLFSYRIVISIILLIYSIIFAGVLLTIALASLISAFDEDSGEGLGFIGFLEYFGLISELFILIFRPEAERPTHKEVDAHGYRYEALDLPGSRVSKRRKKKTLVAAIYDFALGPQRASRDPLSNRQETAAFLTAGRGILTATDIVALSGGGYDRAEDDLVDALRRFDGRPFVSDEGVVIGEFERFSRNENATTRRRSGRARRSIDLYWQEFEQPWLITGNTKKQNYSIFGLGAMVTLFGLLLSSGSTLAFIADDPTSFFSTETARVIFGLIPLYFGLSFLLFPLLRAPFVIAFERRRLERNRRKLLFRTIFENELWSTTPNEIRAAIPESIDSSFDAGTIEAELTALLPELQGAIELDEQGTPRYRFERPPRELQGAAEARKWIRSGKWKREAALE